MNAVKSMLMIATLATLVAGCDPGMRQHGGAMPPPDPPGTSSPTETVTSTGPDKGKQLPDLNVGTTSGSQATVDETPEMARKKRMDQLAGDYVGDYVLPNNTNAQVQAVLNAQIRAAAKVGKPKLTISNDGKFSFFNLGLTTAGDYSVLETVLDCKANFFNGMPYDEFKAKGYKDFQGKIVKPGEDATAPGNFAIEIMDDAKQLRYAPTGNTWILFVKKGS